MRFHVVALPHTRPTEAFSACAYTSKVRGFCRMMMDLGHNVFLYACEPYPNEAGPTCSESIPCGRYAEDQPDFYINASFDPSLPQWRNFNDNAVAAIRSRAQSRDFLCLIAGVAQKPIADALPEMMCVEFGVGYGGSFSNFRVFESYAWMHTCYGAAAGGNPHDADGRWYDAVIPGYLDPEDFPFSDKPRSESDYFLFIGRLIERKGVQIAVDVCKKLGKRLIVAGPGTPPEGGEYAGVVGPEERGRLMAGARAVFVPTIYVEPFGNVAIEAMACGTPVITTDWGAFTETVLQNETGFRCRTFAEFCRGAEEAPRLSPQSCLGHVMANYSLDMIGREYESYFQRLSALWSAEGWYEMPKEAA